MCIYGLAICLFLGGGTRQFEPTDLAAIALALPCFGWGLARTLAGFGGDHSPGAGFGSALIWIGLCVLLLVLQVLPLPPAIWTSLPGRAGFASALAADGAPAGWQSISLSTPSTIYAALTLVPAIGVFLTAAHLGYARRRQVTICLAIFAVISVLLGFMQISAGPTTSLRFFRITNVDSSVGFFANRNHFAALLYSLMLIVSAWSIYWLLEKGSSGNRKSRQRRRSSASDDLNTIAFVGSLATIGVLILGLLIATSRAGILLGGVVMLVTIVFIMLMRGRERGRGPLVLIGGVLFLALLAGAQLAMVQLASRFGSGLTDNVRSGILSSTMELVRRFFPIGAGFGTFENLHLTFERPANATSAVVNRAHNDFAEWALEGGVAALLLALVAIVWIVLANLRVWRSLPGDQGRIDQLLGRLCALVPVLLLVHSIVDYPLRTIALMSLMAFAAAMTIAPPRHSSDAAPQ